MNWHLPFRFSLFLHASIGENYHEAMLSKVVKFLAGLAAKFVGFLIPSGVFILGMR